MTNKKNSKQILAIQVEMGMMVMSLLSESNVDNKTEERTLQVLSMMQAKTCKLLDLSMSEVQEVWRDVKCGIRDLKRNFSLEQLEEIATSLEDGTEGQA